MSDLFSLREKEIFQTLKSLKDCDFVVIGGYAVNVYTLPRFSVDCDIVIRNRKELQRIKELLLQDNYVPQSENDTKPFVRYEKKLAQRFTVSIDLMIGVVVDRITGAHFSADWIFANSGEKLLKGKTIREELKLRIINRDALVVMKMICGRSTDIRDVFLMVTGIEDRDWIKAQIAQRCDLQERIANIIGQVQSPQFRDGLAGVYGFFDAKTFEKHTQALLEFK